MRSFAIPSCLRPIVALLPVVLSATLCAPAARAGVVAYALTENDGLASFDTDNPQRLIDSAYHLSLGRFVGIDFRPSSERVVLVAVAGLNGRQLEFYEVINQPMFGTFTGLATGDTVRPDPADTTDPYDNLFTGVRGTRFGVDFESQRDRMTIVSNNRNVYSVSFEPQTFGLVTTGAELFYVPGDPFAGQSPNVVHIAYAGPTLYGIDSGLDTLVTLDPTTGGVRTVGGLGPAVAALGGFDILATPGGYQAYVVAQNDGAGVSFLYRVDLNTGMMSAPLNIDGGELYDGLAVPEPAAASMAVTGLALMLFRRRR